MPSRAPTSSSVWGGSPLRHRLRCRHSGRASFARPSVLRPQVKLEIRCDRAKLAQGPGLELAHALARDAEPRSDLFQRLGRLAAKAPLAVPTFRTGELRSSVRLKTAGKARDPVRPCEARAGPWTRAGARARA